MVIRIKEIRREERIKNIKELIGGSTIDPTEKIRHLFEIFDLA